MRLVTIDTSLGIFTKYDCSAGKFTMVDQLTVKEDDWAKVKSGEESFTPAMIENYRGAA